MIGIKVSFWGYAVSELDFYTATPKRTVQSEYRVFKPVCHKRTCRYEQLCLVQLRELAPGLGLVGVLLQEKLWVQPMPEGTLVGR